jgi:hypothetical protein
VREGIVWRVCDNQVTWLTQGWWRIRSGIETNDNGKVGLQESIALSCQTRTGCPFHQHAVLRRPPDSLDRYRKVLFKYNNLQYNPPNNG